jgi:hypothetical protein
MFAATELSDLQSQVHGRQRREERRIDKATLKAARRYGMREENPICHGRREKYTYAGITFIYDPIHDCEVTSFPSADYASPCSGTRVTKPILLRKKYAHSPELEKRHEIQHAQTRTELFRSLQNITSHTVYVVDISGSMRQDDVDGARCRSDAVFLTMARNVQNHIEQQQQQQTSTHSHHTTSRADVVSVIVFNETATVVLRCEPIDWILYNTLIDFREWDVIRPRGHGAYLPAMMAAEELFSKYDVGRAPLSLVFCSDGIPSDLQHESQVYEIMGTMASKFGRRLSVACVGIGGQDSEHFSVLKTMVQEANSYGAHAVFHKASLNTASLSQIITTLSTTIVGTVRAEMTDATTGLVRQVQCDVVREKREAPDDDCLTKDWKLYQNHSKSRVVRIWTWNRQKDDFVCCLDPRCVKCCKVVANTDWKPIAGRGMACPRCKACFYCHSCRSHKDFETVHSTETCQKMVLQRRNGEIIHRSVPSYSIAVKTPFFSEGVERLVRKVRFLDETGEIVGPKMVAKQSRFVEEEKTFESTMNYHRQFMRTQALASELAVKFNAALDQLEQRYPQYSATLQALPRIRFLDPFVMEMIEQDGTKINQLVEEMLDGSYEKFNNNMGFIYRHDSVSYEIEHCSEGGDSFPVFRQRKKKEKPQTQSLSDRVENVFQKVLAISTKDYGIALLPTVSEDSENNQDDHVGTTTLLSVKEERLAGSTAIPRDELSLTVNPYNVIQAFSHFTYEKSKKNLLVVDLQGVFISKNEGSEFVLTDPAIHTRSQSSRLSRLNLGRTDRGDRGISTFFKSHVCDETCRLLDLPSYCNYF